MPETVPEMKKCMRRLGEGTLIASDSSKAISAAASSSEKPTAPGARHLFKEFTPLRKLSKKTLPEDVEHMLSEKASSSQSQKPPNVRAGKRKYTFVQGDNLAENRICGIKNKLRRVQFKGRSGPGRASVDVLFAAFLLRQSGLNAVLEALCQYRKFCLSSGFAPSAVFDQSCVNTWLTLAG